MNYACYCNTRVTGGGAVPGAEDPNDELCNDLYKCYKCINIDYDHEGKIDSFFSCTLILNLNQVLMLLKSWSTQQITSHLQKQFNVRIRLICPKKNVHTIFANVTDNSSTVF